MTWFTEDCTPLLVAAGLGEALLAVALYRTGRVLLALPMVVVALLAGGLWFVEQSILTEREQVEATLFGVEAAIRENDVPGVLQYIDPQATVMQAAAEQALGLAEVLSCKITDVQVHVNHLTSPPTARAEIIGTFSVKLRRGEAVPYEHVVRRFAIDLQKSGDQWLMQGYEALQLTGARDGTIPDAPLRSEED